MRSEQVRRCNLCYDPSQPTWSTGELEESVGPLVRLYVVSWRVGQQTVAEAQHGGQHRHEDHGDHLDGGLMQMFRAVRTLLCVDPPCGKGARPEVSWPPQSSSDWEVAHLSSPSWGGDLPGKAHLTPAGSDVSNYWHLCRSCLLPNSVDVLFTRQQQTKNCL